MNSNTTASVLENPNQTDSEDLFNSIKSILDLNGSYSFHEAIGFDDEGNIVHTDGTMVKKMTLEESVKWVAYALQVTEADESADETCDISSRLKWFKMIAEAMDSRG